MAGIQKEKAAGLIEVSVPLIVGHLKNWTLKKGWKFKDLIEYLIENKTVITGALPTGISPAHFGVGRLPKNNYPRTIETEPPTPATPTSKKKNNDLIWFGGLLLLAIILWYLMGNKSCTRSLDTDDMLVPDMTQVIDSPKFYEKPMDGTYYAYEVKPDVVLRRK